MFKNLKIGFCLLIVVQTYNLSFAQNLDVSLRNQFNFWNTTNFQKPLLYQLGGRYIPELSIEKPFEDGKMLDVELSVNAFANSDFTGGKHINSRAKLKPYRAWIRYSTNKFELRAGLQKINFGSASALRPLMWFDQIDARDPLQLTDGVYGLLGRYYFKNNANIWLWTLIANDKQRGWDVVPSIKDKPEFGGRFQFPAATGEAAVSLHHRTTNDAIFISDSVNTNDIPKTENKIGLDGKWDIGVGFWYEVVLKQNGKRQYLNNWEDYINVGVDYTFGLGQGLNVISEFFRINSSDILLGNGERLHFSILTANYPIGIINNISSIIFYNWDCKQWYRFINFQRQYDYWTFYIMAFWNPENYNLYNLGNERTLHAGKGIQLLAVWNF
jgi:hypothetical protein